MHIIRQAQFMPVRRFKCDCCGTDFVATARESTQIDGVWTTDCPFCDANCYAHPGDALTEQEFNAVKKLGLHS